MDAVEASQRVRVFGEDMPRAISSAVHARALLLRCECLRDVLDRLMRRPPGLIHCAKQILGVAVIVLADFPHEDSAEATLF
jgi:hypothetical protein